MKHLKNTLILLIIAVVLSNCSLLRNKVVYYPHEAPVRLAQDVENVRVLVPDDKGNLNETNKTLKAGQYVVSKSAE